MKQLTLGLMLVLMLPMCTSISTLQTARVVPEGKKEMITGLSYPTGTGTFPTPFWGGRVPISERLDFGGSLGLLNGRGDLKYQFFDSPFFAASTGFSIALFHYYLIWGGNCAVPLILSIDLNDSFSIYSSQRVGVSKIERTSFGMYPSKAGIESFYYHDHTLGVKLGTRQGFYFELNYAALFTRSDSFVIQASGAYFILFESEDAPIP